MNSNATTVREFQGAAKEILNKVFALQNYKAHNVTASVLLGNYNDDVFYCVGCFLTVDSKNIHISTNGKSTSEALEKFKMQCEFDKASIVVEQYLKQADLTII